MAARLSDDLHDLVRRSDLDGLVRLVDALGETRDWAGLERLRRACRSSGSNNVWPAATLAEYRIALFGPPESVARVLGDEPGRFALGPLTEVAAQHHDFADLAPLLGDGPVAAVLAHECALRGQLIDAPPAFDVFEIPVAPTAGEPRYPLAVYRDAEARFDSPIPPSATEQPTGDGEAIDVATGLAEAARMLVEPWVESSNGSLRAATASGGVLGALRALGSPDASVAPLNAGAAMAWLGWAGASGGAHGRRRGAATGRFNCWWFLAALAGEAWPVDDGAVLAERYEWWWFDDGSQPIGWSLRLVAHDRARDRSFAISAGDAREVSLAT